MMKLKLFTDLDLLESHCKRWDSVAGEFPFFRWSWMGNWMRHLGTDLELAVLVAIDENGEWVGIAPWCVDSRTPFSRRLRFLGSGETCSDYLDLICSDDHYDEFSATVVDWLDANIGVPQTLGRIDVIDLEGVTSSSPRLSNFCELLEARGYQRHSTELEGGWRVELPSSWDELNASLSKSMRRKTKKAIQRLKEDNTSVMSSSDEPLDKLWPQFVALHQQRREMLGQAGCFASPDFGHFLKAATNGLMLESKAELICLSRNNRPLAAMLLLHDRETTYMYQSGLDPQDMKQEPGHQIAVCAISRAIANQSKYFDFLRGDEPYKARWNTTRIPIQRTRFIPGHSMAKLKHGIWLAGRSVKHWMAPPVTLPPVAS